MGNNELLSSLAAQKITDQELKELHVAMEEVEACGNGFVFYSDSDLLSSFFTEANKTPQSTSTAPIMPCRFRTSCRKTKAKAAELTGSREKSRAACSGVDNIWQVYMKAPTRNKRSPEWKAKDS